MIDIADYDTHNFLLNASNELSQAARNVPVLRSHIEGLSETAATFRLKHVDGIYESNFSDVLVEFCKSWRVHEMYAPEAERVFVNPNYAHAHCYTDLVVSCDCGAQFSRNYQDDHNSLRDEHDHAVDCMPHWRLRSRADVLRERWQMMQRLARLGWRGSDMASRLGARTDAMGPYAEQFNTTITKLYQEYRRLTANTYRYLVRHCGENSETVATIYDHHRDTLSKWESQHAELPLPNEG